MTRRTHAFHVFVHKLVCSFAKEPKRGLLWLSHPRRHARADPFRRTWIHALPHFAFEPPRVKDRRERKLRAEMATFFPLLPSFFLYRWLAEKLAGGHNACDRDVAGHNETVIGREGFDGSFRERAMGN